MRLLLQHKIFIGYFLLMAVIGCMVAIVLHERKRVSEIEQESITIFQTQSNISTTHRHITVLATFGESVMTWTGKDCELYRTRRLKADSLLQILREQCKEFVRPEQVDSLRSQLLNKEEHLLRMKEIFRQQKQIDSLLAGQYSLVTSQANTSRTVTRKKKGIAGLFGGKETVQLPSANTKVRARGNELISLQEERRRNIETYTDSLRLHNRELNGKLRTLITSLDEQALSALRNKEVRLKDSYEHSTLVITGLIIFSIILLFVLYLIIQRDIKIKARNRKRLEETIEQNNALLEMRKNIILTISHDIRAPLNIISGSAELAMDTREKKRRNNHMNNIRIVCKHVVHLLNNLLDVYRLNEAKETRNDVPFSLKDLLERTVFGFSHVVNNKGILFCHDFKDTDVKLYGDVDRIEQIIDNLLSNAVKFTETGTISLNASYSEGVLLLEVKDTGIGMSEETLSRIFRPFERLSSVANGNYVLCDKDNYAYTNAGQVMARYRLANPNNPKDGIMLDHQIRLTNFTFGSFTLVGATMTYDGHLVVAAQNGLLVLNRALTTIEDSYPLPSDQILTNSICIDENGGVYVASNSRTPGGKGLMQKLICKDGKISTSQADGAWQAYYDGGPQAPCIKLGHGTGSTPTLMGFGQDKDKLVVITDGSKRMKLVAFWRDEIPSDAQQVAGYDKRIAGVHEVTCGLGTSTEWIQSEQSVVVGGYDAFVVNNINVTNQEINDKIIGVIAIGPIVKGPQGAECVRWNTKEKKWESKWTRSDVSSVSMIPAVSIKSEMVFVCGWNDASGWEVTGLDWKSGATRHRSILGKNNRANGAYAIIQYLANGDLLFNSVAGPIRVKY